MFNLPIRVSLVAVVAGTVMAAAGCKKDAPTPPAEPPKTTEEAKSADQPAEASPATAPAEASAAAADASPTDAPAAASGTAAPDAASVLAPGQKFEFSLKNSLEALAFHTKRCADEAKGDAAKQQACLDDAGKAVEGVRLEKEGDAWVMVTCGTKADGTEEIQSAVLWPSLTARPTSSSSSGLGRARAQLRLHAV